MREIISKIKNYYRPYFRNRDWLLFSILSSLIIILILFDVLSKIGVYHAFSDVINGHVVLKQDYQYMSYKALFGLMNIRLVFNTGAAFSAFSSAPSFANVFLPILSLIMFIVLIYIYIVYFDFMPNMVKLFLVLISSGCFGNMVDRFGRLSGNKYYRNGVIDFIDVTPMFPFFRAIFNVADVLVVASFVTAIIYGIYYLIIYMLNKKQLETSQNGI